MLLPAERGGRDGLLSAAKLHYNRRVHSYDGWLNKGIFGLGLLSVAASLCLGQQAPSVSGARILLLPRKIVSGERATLAVLDVAGRLTPGVTVVFSDGEKITTDPTGRALFVAPLNPGVLSGVIEGRAGRVTSVILRPEEAPSTTLAVTLAPRVASLSDRFELMGNGFCGDADANHVSIAGLPGLVLAASPADLTVLPPTEMDPGPAKVHVSCGGNAAEEFTVVFVSLELEASNAPLAPGEHRSLAVRVRGSTAKISLEARNLAPEVAELQGGSTVRAASSGGADNLARFEVVGKQRGSFMISIRLQAPLSKPKP